MEQGERVKQLRKELGLTLEKFGSKLGVGKTTISKIENGVNKLTDQMSMSICREFNVSAEWLRDGSGEMFILIDQEDELMSWAGQMLSEVDDSFKKKFIRMLMSMDEEEWRLVERKVKELAEDPRYTK